MAAKETSIYNDNQDLPLEAYKHAHRINWWKTWGHWEEQRIYKIPAHNRIWILKSWALANEMPETSTTQQSGPSKLMVKTSHLNTKKYVQWPEYNFQNFHEIIL